MTGRERLLALLKGEKVDRLPVSPFLYYNAVYEMFGYVPRMENGMFGFWEPDDFDPITKFVEYCDYFGFDVINPLGSDWYAHINSYKSGDNWDVSITEEKTGEDERRRIVNIRTPGGELRESQNIKRSSKHLIVCAPDEYLIKTPEDFELVRKYIPPAEEIDTSIAKRAIGATGDKGLGTPFTYGAFSTLCQFRNLEQVIMDPYVDECRYREMMDFFTDRTIRQNKKWVEAGAELIEEAGNLATSALGPEFFASFVLPYEKKVIDDIHALGAYVIYHNCGDAAKIMHMYNEMGCDVWGYLTPAPFGDVDIDEALRVIRPEMVLRGNIDQVEFMMKAIPLEVKERVRDLVLKVKDRGSFIVSTTDFFFDKTPYENIKAFREAAVEFGTYRPTLAEGSVTI